MSNLCDPTDCSPPGSSVRGILQARIPEWVVMPSSRGSSQPRDQTGPSCIGGQILYCLSHQASPAHLPPHSPFLGRGGRRQVGYPLVPSWSFYLPFRPGRPGNPVAPGKPEFPRKPIGPGGPGSPFSPGRPLFPADAGRPISPLGPFFPGCPESAQERIHDGCQVRLSRSGPLPIPLASGWLTCWGV